MGITQQAADKVVAIYQYAGLKVEKPRMLELGAQYMRGPDGPGFSQDHFEGRNFEVVSLDWNGEGRAKKVDIAEPFDEGQFDLVTNFGTTEHVSNQRVVMKNIHDACKVGGLMIHNVPGTHPKHRRHGKKYGWVLQYTEKFFPNLAEDNGYEVINLNQPDWLIWCVLKKVKDAEFTWRN